MSSAYFRLEKSLHIPNAWAVSIPIESAKLVMRSPQVRRAVARVFMDVARGRVYLVLWVGVDPRWVGRTILRLFSESDAPRTDVVGVTKPPRAVPSTQQKAVARRSWEPRGIPAGALAC
ncbi:hypothetical protein [Frigoriglobus tundricola]|uniref:Uncharacterized protein n=1 Tax=Frigoriglobus tundricola TaxID=2774151 RepID=A0A6M5YZG1_9BACT|nr:hypothetical protein [Frigoriglobus tundricola]QJW98846.1 hypothetical protein FTUN_6441 [Frigoriglobus tundricola]